MTHIRTPSKAYNNAGRHIGPGPWLNVIHEANRIAPDTFGEPLSTGDWWAGGYVEEYEDARVLHRPDDSTSIISKTDHGATVLAEAAAHLGIHTS